MDASSEVQDGQKSCHGIRIALGLTEEQPPGPFPWPIVGNTFQLPDSKPWIYFERLSKEYKTPLITYWIGRFVDAKLFYCIR